MRSAFHSLAGYAQETSPDPVRLGAQGHGLVQDDGPRAVLQGSEAGLVVEGGQGVAGGGEFLDLMIES